jgi:hypothetical protein
MDTVDFIMQYECGELSKEEIIAGFQALIDSGLVWTLQGHYGRVARALIEAGHCRRATQTRKEIDE